MSKEKANSEEIPINLAIILDKIFNLGTNIDNNSNKLKSKKTIDQSPTPKTLELFKLAATVTADSNVFNNDSITQHPLGA